MDIDPVFRLDSIPIASTGASPNKWFVAYDFKVGSYWSLYSWELFGTKTTSNVTSGVDISSLGMTAVLFSNQDAMLDYAKDQGVTLSRKSNEVISTEGVYNGVYAAYIVAKGPNTDIATSGAYPAPVIIAPESYPHKGKSFTDTAVMHHSYTSDEAHLYGFIIFNSDPTASIDTIHSRLFLE